jgi:DivIVA domain-containing protein
VTSAGARDIEDHEFPPARRGYDTAAVRAFLGTVATRIRDLAQSLESRTAESLKLQQELELARLSIRTNEAELANQRLRQRDLSSRLELAEALRTDALARAVAAESGRQYAEQLLAQAEAGHGPEVDLREPRQPAEQHLRHSVGARAEHSRAGSMPDLGPALSETDQAVRSLLANSFQQTAEHIREIEEAAEALVETTKAQAQRILDGARRDAETITSSARRIAELWDSVLGAVRADIAKGNRTLTGLGAGIHPTTAPAAAPPSTFTTNQARSAASSLHAAARDDLHLAEFWIHEAEQEAGDDATLTSRSILQEAYQLLMMAEELGHPAADLLDMYRDLGRRLQRLLE